MTKTLCGPVSTFYRGNARKKVQIRYCIIWRCLHLMFSTTNVSDKWNMWGYERMLSYEQYPEEKSHLWLSSFGKKLISLHGGQLNVIQTYTSNRVHFIQIQSAAPSFMGIWAIRSPLKIHCYTCMSFETCRSRVIYTKLSSHRSFVINMYVVTMAWRCISPWRLHRSLQRRRQIDIFHICQQISTFWSKNNQKKKKKKEENFDSTVVNTYSMGSGLKILPWQAP